MKYWSQSRRRTRASFRDSSGTFSSAAAPVEGEGSDSQVSRSMIDMSAESTLDDQQRPGQAGVDGWSSVLDRLPDHHDHDQQNSAIGIRKRAREFERSVIRRGRARTACKARLDGAPRMTAWPARTAYRRNTDRPEQRQIVRDSVWIESRPVSLMKQREARRQQIVPARPADQDQVVRAQRPAQRFKRRRFRVEQSLVPWSAASAQRSSNCLLLGGTWGGAGGELTHHPPARRPC